MNMCQKKNESLIFLNNAMRNFICISLCLSVHVNAFAQTAAKYIGYTADINGDGQPDILVKVIPPIVMIPLDDDINIPIAIPTGIPSFALISNGSGTYQINTEVKSISSDPRWVNSGVSVSLNANSNSSQPLLIIDYSGANAQVFASGVSYETTNCGVQCSPYGFAVNILPIIVGARIEGYEYDPLGRLIKVKWNGVLKTQYNYDKAGNRQQITE